MDDENTANADDESDSASSVSDRSTAQAPVPSKKKRSNVSEVLGVLKEHMSSVQNARQQEAMQRQKEMHEERMAVPRGFLDFFKKQ